MRRGAWRTRSWSPSSARRSARNAPALADFRGFLQRGWRATLFMAEVDGMMRVLDTENRYAPR